MKRFVFLSVCILNLFPGYECQGQDQIQGSYNINRNSLLGLASSLQNLAGNILTNLQQGNPVEIQFSTNFGGNSNNPNFQENQQYPSRYQQTSPPDPPDFHYSRGPPGYGPPPGPLPGYPGFGPPGHQGYDPRPGFGFPDHGHPGPPPGPPPHGPPPPGPPPPHGNGPPGPPFGPPSHQNPPHPGNPGQNQPLQRPDTQADDSDRPIFNANEDVDRQKISGYIDGDFPVILLEKNDIR